MLHWFEFNSINPAKYEDVKNLNSVACGENSIFVFFDKCRNGIFKIPQLIDSN